MGRHVVFHATDPEIRLSDTQPPGEEASVRWTRWPT